MPVAPAVAMPKLPRSVRRAVLLLGAGGLIAVAFAALHGHWDALCQACARIGPYGLLPALGLTLLNLQLRFARWQLYLRAQGHALPRLLHQLMFVAGFAFALTPAGAGDASRALLLRRRGVRYAHSAAALLSERVSDLLVLLLLAALLHGWLLAAALGTAALALSATPLARWRGWPRSVRRLLRQTRRCLAPRLLLRARVLGIAAWGAEALAFHAIGLRLGLTLPLSLAAGVYALSLLAGALSIAPGGVGGVELAMVALLMGCGASLPDALAVTLLTRVATLWFTVALGGAALASLRLAHSGLDAAVARA